jgi:hypothetical protein
MNQSNRNPMDGADKAAPHGPRGAWTTPKLSRLRARDAELGSNPFVGEGVFGKGS